jgi:plasmid stability protein
MRRTQIYLDDDLDEELRTLASAQGRSAAAVIREALRVYLVSQIPKPTADPILTAAGTVVGLPRDASTEHDRDLYGEQSRRRLQD